MKMNFTDSSGRWLLARGWNNEVPTHDVGTEGTLTPPDIWRSTFVMHSIRFNQAKLVLKFCLNIYWMLSW